MTVMRCLMIAFVPLALAGCVSEQDEREMDNGKCSSYGFVRGTDAFANCMMTQGSQRAEREQRERESYRRASEQRERDRDRDRRKAHHKRDRDIDTVQQYDKDGNPNFDTKGGYIGCHGVGCMVDDPDEDD